MWKVSVAELLPMVERIKIRVVPNARKNFPAGSYGGGVKIKIAAPASDGRANAVLVAFLAERLGVSKRDVVIISGKTSRDKLVEIDGAGNSLKKLLDT